MTTKISSRVLATAAVKTINITPASVGSTELKNNAVLSAHYGNLSIPTAAYGDLSITNGKLVDRTLTGIKIALGGVLGENIGNGEVHTANLADGAVLFAKFGDREIHGVKVGIGGLINEHYADGSVDSRVLGTSAVTNTKLGPGSVSPSKLTTGTQGDMFVAGSGGNYAVLPKGPEGSVLAVTGGAVAWSSSILVPGVLADYLAASAPSGWVMANGRTIGSASSGATERANADCAALYGLLWNNFGDGVLPVVGGRGSSSDADFAANKPISLPDLRGRSTVGSDSMNNSVANRVTVASPSGSTLGATGGSETTTLTTDMLPPHGHTMFEYHNVSNDNTDIPNGIASGPSDYIYSGAWPDSKRAYKMAKASNAPNCGATSAVGSGTPFTNMGPFFITNKIIKL